MMRKMGSN